MAPSSKHSASKTDCSNISVNGKEMLDDGKGCLPHVENRSPYLPTATHPTSVDIEVTYPEGGRDAWFVVLGAFSGLTASLGIYNTAGVFEAVISRTLLPQESTSTLGWIFSTYAFVTWICGVQNGPTLDALGPRVLLTAGIICTLVGVFALSVCTGKIGSHMIAIHPPSSWLTIILAIFF